MKIALLALAVLFLLFIPGFYLHWQTDYAWFDQCRHFLGGFFVAMLFREYLKNHLIGDKRLNNILIIVGVSTLIGVLWEFSEYIASQTLTELIYEKFSVRVYFMGDLKDTVSDLLLDMTGALIFMVLHFFRSRNAHQAEADFKNLGNGAA